MDDRAPTCIACDAAAPRGRLFRAAGWKARRVQLCGALVIEVHCPECFKKWGWTRDTSTPEIMSQLTADPPPQPRQWG